MAGKNTTTNLPLNMASALCYVPVVGWIAAIVLLVVEKNAAVKWNAVQALFLMGIIWALAMAVSFVWVAGLVLQLVLAVKAYQGETVKLPILRGWTDKIIKKV